MSDPTTGDDSYLFVVDYADDAERKRVEYLFNNLDADSVENPSGLVRLVSGVDPEDLHRELASKVPDDQVKGFALDAVDPDHEPETVRVTQTVDTPADAVDGFLQYVLSKKKAVLQSDARNEYEIYTKKGRTDVRYALAERDDATEVTVTVSGHQPAPGFLGEFFERELADYASSQR